MPKTKRPNTIGDCPVNIDSADARLVAADWFEEHGEKRITIVLRDETIPTPCLKIAIEFPVGVRIQVHGGRQEFLGLRGIVTGYTGPPFTKLPRVLVSPIDTTEVLPPWLKTIGLLPRNISIDE